jgi:hypothetical protein
MSVDRFCETRRRSERSPLHPALDPAQKGGFRSVLNSTPNAKPAGVAGGEGLKFLRLGEDGRLDGRTFHCAANIDEVVTDHTETDPALHSRISFVPTAIEPVPPLDHADASLASGPPLLAIALRTARLGGSTIRCKEEESSGARRDEP